MSSERTRAKEKKQAAKDFLAGCTLVSLLYMDVLRLLFAAPGPFGFYLAYSRNHYLAAIAAVVFGGVIMMALSPAARRAPAGIRYVLNCALLATTVLVLNEFRKSNEDKWPMILGVWTGVRHTPELAVMIIVMVVAIAVILRFVSPLSRWYRQLLLVTSVFTIYVLARALWILATMNFNSFQLLPRPAHAGLPGVGRVVIVVFDEMDNEVAFARRPSSLALPQFDAFRKTSVTFDSAYSPGPNTLESMPSYLLARRVLTLRPLDATSFVARIQNGNRVLSDTATSIFTKPAEMGARTALVGFALPYCRLRLTAMVDVCETIPLVAGQDIDVDSAGFWHAASEQVQSLLPFSARRAHIARLRVVMDKAVELAGDSSYSLVLLHLPLPHAPWVWDQASRSFVVNSLGNAGYLGNLALADEVLGRMRKEMTDRRSWATTTLIVTTDHSWRSKPAQGGPVDRRIPLMIKLAGMTDSSHVSTPTNSLIVSGLVPDLINRALPDAQSLSLRIGQLTAGIPDMRVH